MENLRIIYDGQFSHFMELLTRTEEGNCDWHALLKQACDWYDIDPQLFVDLVTELRRRNITKREDLKEFLGDE